jgi:hypothetical protein
VATGYLANPGGLALELIRINNFSAHPTVLKYLTIDLSHLEWAKVNTDQKLDTT